MRARPIAVQFMEDNIVAMFELVLQGVKVKVVEEKHWRLVPASDLNQGAIRDYR